MAAIVLGGPRTASITLRPGSSVARVRRSWQPTQPVVSPGMTVQKLCIRLTELLCSSSATKNKGRSAGTSKNADPSGSTGTVPTTRSSVYVPPKLIEQLAVGGRLCHPVGGRWGAQDLAVITKQPDGSATRRSLIPVVFVPMTGEAQRR